MRDERVGLLCVSPGVAGSRSNQPSSSPRIKLSRHCTAIEGESVTFRNAREERSARRRSGARRERPPPNRDAHSTAFLSWA